MLQNKTILIIGGTSGIGIAAAQFFVQSGANVCAVGRDDEYLESATKIIEENGFVLAADITKEETAVNAIAQCVEKFGKVDGLYHVAGGSGRRFGDGPLHELTLEGWNKTMELNLTSIMLSNQAAVKYFLENNISGSILNLGSVLGYRPSKTYFSTHTYAAAKGAIIAFSKSIAAYYAEYNIRVNVLAPSLVETPMSKRASENSEIMNFVKTKQPLDGGRNGQTDDLDGAAAYFLSDLSKFTTGQVLAVDGGWGISDGQL
ncbi:MAG: NAD(P)-dependent dehydrogenase (short-subunit alcohol dehydrogenase family) [Spirosomataceae bacterium]|jgi:NAD(P)-dependent dehydrogenase (short-subunit alcohol dehydrogenase family)